MATIAIILLALAALAGGAVCVLFVVPAFLLRRMDEREAREYEDWRRRRPTPSGEDVVRTFRFAGALPRVLAGANPVQRLRSLAQRHHRERIELHQRTERLHEQVDEPNEGHPMVGRTFVEDDVHVTVTGDAVTVSGSTTSRLADAVASALTRLGAVEDRTTCAA